MNAKAATLVLQLVSSRRAKKEGEQQTLTQKVPTTSYDERKQNKHATLCILAHLPSLHSPSVSTNTHKHHPPPAPAAAAFTHPPVLLEGLLQLLLGEVPRQVAHEEVALLRRARVVLQAVRRRLTRCVRVQFNRSRVSEGCGLDDQQA